MIKDLGEDRHICKCTKCKHYLLYEEDDVEIIYRASLYDPLQNNPVGFNYFTGIKCPNCGYLTNDIEYA